MKDMQIIINDGIKSKLTNHMGARGLIIFFYPMASSPGCSIEMANFQKLYSDFKTLDYEVMGASKNKVKNNYKFKCKLDVEFPIISDENKELTNIILKETNNDKMHRNTYVFDTELQLIEAFNKVSVFQHATELLEYLKEK